MGMNDFWQGFNTVDNFITNRRKLDLAEQRAARDAALEDERRGWERQDRQRADQRLELAGQMARIDAGTATPEELEAARKKYVPASKGMQPVGVIGPQATQVPKEQPTEWDGTKALEGLVQQRTDLVTQALGKLDAAQKAGQPPQLDEHEARALVEVPVQSNLFTDDDPGKQHMALQTIEAHLSALGNVPGKVMINDPDVLAAVEIAYPQTVKGSNLKGARVSAVYIDPSPDGDPMKAKITVGIAGKNDKGEDVDGVLTEKRTSDPDDAILQLPAGEWLTMAEGKRRILEGMAAARVALGDEKAWETVKSAREARDLAKVYEEKAADVQEPKLQQRLKFIAAQIKLGSMKTDEARKLADDIFPVKADDQIAKLLLEHQFRMEQEDRRDEREAMREDRRDKRLTIQLGSLERRAATRGSGMSDVEFRQSKAAARKEIDMTFRDMSDTKKAAEREFAQQKEEEIYGTPDWTLYNRLRAEYNEKRRNYESVLQGYADQYGDVYAPGAVRKPAQGGMAPTPPKPDVNALLFGKGMAPAPQKGKAPASDVDAQAQAAIQTVNADKSLTPAQKQVKINAIQQRRNQLVGGR